MTYQPKMQPRADQQEALDKMEGKESFALLNAPRTGKSKILIDDFGRMEAEGEVQDFLLEAPGGVYQTWKGAFADHASDDLQERCQVHVWHSGAGKAERNALKVFLAESDPRRPRFFLLNAEAISRQGEAREAVETFLDSGTRRKKIMGIDESVLNKNPAAAKTKYNNRVLRPMTHYRRILSGLATPRSPLDIFAQFEFLNWRILRHRSFFTFRNRYAVVKQEWFGGRRVPVVVGYQNQDELRQLIEPHSYRVEFRPKIPSTYSLREVELTSEQRRIYDEIKQFATSKIEGESHVTATVVIAQIMRLHQVLCGHVRDEQGKLHEIPENRTKELMEILDDYSGSAIIWCSYAHDIEKIAKALRKEYGPNSVARFYGGNVDTREDEERRFKTIEECRFMIATPDAGRFGRTWEGADLTIFFSSSNNLDFREQAEQRPLGVTKDRGVDYIDLIVKSSVEEKIIQALRAKIDMSTLINGDNYKSWLI